MQMRQSTPNPEACKVYTAEEIKLLNLYFYDPLTGKLGRNQRNLSNEWISLHRPLAVWIPLDATAEVEVQTVISRLRQLHHHYYEAELSYSDVAPYNSGKTIWVMHISKDGPRPIMRSW